MTAELTTILERQMSKKPKPYLVDEKCIEIANHFLSDVAATDEKRRELAEDIQKLCEAFCSTLERDRQRS